MHVPIFESPQRDILNTLPEFVNFKNHFLRRECTYSIFISIMVRANIQYSKTGVIPPVYLAGSFTEWQPSIEMQQEIIEEQPSRQYRFSTSVEVDPGEYQYKLRLGPGDWWTTDETVPTGMEDAIIDLTEVEYSHSNRCRWQCQQHHSHQG